MAERVKVYEETKKGIPVWAWLLPLLLLLAPLAYFLTHRAAPMVSSTAAAPAFPDLGSVHLNTDKATLTSEGQATLQQAAAAGATCVDPLRIMIMGMVIAAAE